ncbi:MAG: PAS domain S-box protein [Kiritimatiellae bacterium]|nr:PAS domain S-box protein [Kiritimatiellia bacterium]
MIFLEIINNLALLALIAIFSGYFDVQCPGERRVACLHGLLFGFACVVGMTCPVRVAPGLFYDGRSVMLSICGLFFGPLAVAVAAAMALVCRIAQGGIGMIQGIPVIVSAALLGLAFRHREKANRHAPSAKRLLSLGITVHVLMVLFMLPLPAYVIKDNFWKIALPVLTVYPLVTILVGKVLSDHLSRTRLFCQVQENEERFRTSIYSIGDGLIITDINGNLSHMNPMAEKLTGWSEAEAKGRPCSEIFNIINESTRKRVESPVKRVLQEGVVVGLANHTLLIARDGTERPVADSGAPIRHSCGNITGVVLVFRDQTEAREYAQRLEYNESKLRQLVKNAPIGIFTTTYDGYFSEINDTMAHILGYGDARQVLADNPNIAKHFYVVPELRKELLEKLTEEGQVKTFESELKTLDQRRIWLSWNARAIYQGEDKPFLIEGFAVDVTERKQREMEAQRSANRMGVLLRIISKPVNNVQELLDYALDEILQMTKSKIGYIYHYDEHRRQFTLNSWSKDVMRECSVVQPKTVYNLDKTGIWGEVVRQRKPILVNDFAAFNPLKKGTPAGHVQMNKFLAVPIFQDEQIVGTVGVANKDGDYDAEDVIQIQILIGSVWKEVARKKAEDAHTLLSGQLMQSQKMEAVGRLAGGIAHDFNNILQAMLGYSELLKDNFASDKEATEILGEVISEGRRAADLTNQLLAFARKQAINPRVVNINEAITNLLKMLQRLIGEDIDLRWKPGENICLVKIDLSQIDQIMANLAVNARDAISGVGTLTVETDSAYLDETYCAKNIGAVCGNYVLLTVSDNGCGMEPALAEHIFEPFFTTKERGKGTGLGLATVYGIVKQNGGHISVATEPHKGTIFRIYLPAYFDDDTTGIQQPRMVETPPVGTETVMVVDDEASMLRSVQLTLQSLGYNVLAALGSEKAAALSQSYADEIHLLLTDVVMPKHSGRDLQKIILSQRPGIKCIFMSGYTADIIANHGVLEEGLNFIQKPFSRTDLAVKIREVLAQKQTQAGNLR